MFVHRVTVLQEPDQLAACGWFEANPGGTADRPKDDLRISNHDVLTGWVSWVRGKLPKHDVASWEPDKATFPMPNTQALAWHLAGTTLPSVKNGEVFELVGDGLVDLSQCLLGVTGVRNGPAEDQHGGPVLDS